MERETITTWQLNRIAHLLCLQGKKTKITNDDKEFSKLFFSNKNDRSFFQNI